MDEECEAGVKWGHPSTDPGTPHTLFKSGIKSGEKATSSLRDNPGSCLSMKSNCSKDVPIIFSNEPGHPHSRSPSSTVSLDNKSLDVPIIFSKEPGGLSSRFKSGIKSGETSTPSDKPGPCLSVKSDCSKDVPIIFSNEPGPSHSRSPCSALSLDNKSLDVPIIFSKEPGGLSSRCLSLKSKSPPIIFGHEPGSSDVDFLPETDPSGQQAQLDTIFKRLETHIVNFIKNELMKFCRILRFDCTECLENAEDEGQRSREAFLTITLEFLKKMKHEELADQLHKKSYSQAQRKLKSSLQQRYQCVFEGLAKEGNPTFLNQVYTDLYITEGVPGGVNNEHEVRQIEGISRKPATPENTITCKDIFKGFGHRKAPVRTVLTKGVAGIGKTVLTQKFSLDWAEGQSNQEIKLLFPFTFRELNLLRDRQFSLVELVHHFFGDAAVLCQYEDLDVVFIFDGLDEWRLPLNFASTRALSDTTETVPLDVLLVNLIKGTLLPSAHLWITTRPAAANQIPAECVSMVTEVRGFTDMQKEQYFQKKFEDQKMARAIISHMKKSKSLYIMCHIPVFCWITATVLQHVMESWDRNQLPQTLTEIYIYFLVVQTKIKSVRYDRRSQSDPHWSPETTAMVESLGKLAFEQLQKRNIIFYESDLIDCGLDPTAAAVYSGVFTQVFRKETNLYQDMVYCFVHLSVQEFLAALHVHLTFFNSGVNLLSTEKRSEKFEPIRRKLSLWLGFAEANFYQSAVDIALQNQNGDYDLFLRFLMGLALSTNQNLLHGLLPQTGGSAKTNTKTVKYIHEKVNGDLSAERILNLFHCLNELNDRTLVKEIQQYLRTGHLESVSPGLWSALAYLILSSVKDLNTFNLKEYCASEVALLRLLPVIKASNKALLSGCNLSERSCDGLASVLSCQFSSLCHLDLSNNDLRDSGVQQLCTGLKSSVCRLESLSLGNCNLTKASCGHLSSVLASQSRGLKQLDLSNNLLKNPGVNLLCSSLRSPVCRLETLTLSGCLISEEGGASLASTLSSTPSSCLRELDLSHNHPGASAVGHLAALCEDQQRTLVKLRVEPSGVQWLNPGLQKYFRELILDPNSTEKGLVFSEENRTVRHMHLRFLPYFERQLPTYYQTLCSSGLTGRCYWEVAWTGEQLCVAVSYKSNSHREFGQSEQSWALKMLKGEYFVCHNSIQNPVSSSSPGSQVRNLHQSRRSGRLGIYLDHEAGMLSVYEATTGRLLHLHSFSASFTEPLFAGFGLWSGTCLSLAEVRIMPPGGLNLLQGSSL